MSEKKNRLTLLKEALSWGGPETPKTIEKTGIIVINETKQSAGKALDDSFDTQLTTFNSDPVVKESIIQFAQEVIGNGYFTTMNKDYSLELDGETAKDLIDEWNYKNDIDNKILQVSIELVAFGNSFYYITNNGFQNIPIQAIYKANAVDKSTPIEEKYNLETSGTYGAKNIKWEDFIHFKVPMPSEFTPFSSAGIIHGLIAYPDEDNQNPSMWDIRKSMRKYMNLGFKKFSFANELWTFPESDDTKVAAFQTTLNTMSDIGQKIATNAKGSIQIAVPQRTTSYDEWIKSSNNEFLMSLANPSLKLGVEGFYTKATGETAQKMFGMKIESIRRIIKRTFEDLWIKILEKNGFDGQKAQVKMNFGSEEVSYTTSDLFAAKDKGLISIEEARKILRESMKWKLEEEIPVEKVTPVAPTVPLVEFTEIKNKVESLTSEKSKLEEESIKKRMKVMDELLKGETK